MAKTGYSAANASLNRKDVGGLNSSHGIVNLQSRIICKASCMLRVGKHAENTTQYMTSNFLRFPAAVPEPFCRALSTKLIILANENEL
jgi:hypothetical protein